MQGFAKAVQKAQRILLELQRGVGAHQAADEG